MVTDSLFRVENLRVSYPGSPADFWAVDDVSFTLQPGEKLGLVGESGCGKSTLGLASMRLLPVSSPMEGRVLFEGESIFDMERDRMRRFRGEAIALIFQDPMTRLDPLMTIGDHCLETLLSHEGQLTRKDAKNRALEILEAVNIPASRWAQYPHEFSGGMRQRVAIALALLLNPKLIVADEPTTSLDVTVSAQILKELTRLCRDRGTAILLISHDLAMVGEYCDRIAVMYQGKIVETGITENVFRAPQHDYTKTLLNSALHLQVKEVRSSKFEAGNYFNNSAELPENFSGNPLLKLTDLKQYYTLEKSFLQQIFSQEPPTSIKAVDGITLDLYEGEILGLVGESGCGKSTLSRTILQLIRPTGGKVEFEGIDLTRLSREKMRKKRRQMQMIFQDPQACLNPMMTVGQSIADPLLIHQLATVAEAKLQVLQMLERVGLTPVQEYYQRYPKELSGGQQQRVAIARALITRPQLIICDEPVSMLDATVQSQVLELMLELKREFNLTYLFITHDLWVAKYLCDRIAVMKGGQIVELGETQTIFNSPQHPYTQELLQAAPLLAKI
jgi:peptide/nickel transport system ATP-binding protein